MLVHRLDEHADVVEQRPLGVAEVALGQLEVRAADLEPPVAGPREAEPLHARAVAARDLRFGARRGRDRAPSRSPPRRARARALAEVDQRLAAVERGHAQARSARARPVRAVPPRRRASACPARVGAEQREAVGLLDPAQPEPLDRDRGQALRGRRPRGDVIERRRFTFEDSRSGQSTCGGRPRAAAASSSSSGPRSPGASLPRRAGRACVPARTARARPEPAAAAGRDIRA